MDVDPESEVFSRLCNSVMLVTTLIPHTAGGDLPKEVQIACMECWAFNLRLLVEFLLLKPPSNCASASDLLETWDMSVVGCQEMLKADYGWASQFVAHIAQPKPGELERNVHPRALKPKAELMVDAVACFAEQLEEAEHAYAGIVRECVDEARRTLDAKSN
ncbi:MAG TPA: hypothetical protein PKE05_04755 [Microthrixaceae bacterium]|nr:hypothetical protein [Microthrixaceae bacterium]